ncbi:hypothetical protein GALL_460370 [mine drainage metagenome]|uniref:Uncharacterized protein n=1 Tax=mine drainage metagenome TaxID=410659 RepID=A0A1J5Q4E3_9ZZZZ
MDRHGIFQLDLVRHRRLRPPDQRDIGRGAAHVIGQKVLHPRPSPGIGRRHHTRGRPRHHCFCGLFCHQARRNHAAVAVHHQHVAAIAPLGKLLDQPRDIPLQQGLHRGIDRRRHPPLKLAAFRQKRVAQCDVIVGPEAPQNRSRGQFMRRIGIGVQVMHHDRNAARRQQRPPGALYRGLVQRHHDCARGIHPLGHFQPQIAGDDGDEMPRHSIGLRACPTTKL